MELTKINSKSPLYQKQHSVFADWICNVSPSSRRTYLSILKSFEAFLKSNDLHLDNINQITPKILMAYRDHLSGRLANKTTNLHLATLSSVFDEYVFNQTLDSNPMNRIRRPDSSTKKIKYHLSDDEIQRLVRTFRENQFHLKCAFILMATTAQRGSSILNLKKSNIFYLENKMILSLITKGHKQRLLPVPLIAEGLLKELIENKNADDYLFVGRGQMNKPLSLSSFNATLKVKARKARIEKEISTHTMRRSLVSKLIMKGHSLDHLKDSLTFHSDINTLYQYRSNEEYNLKENPILKDEIKLLLHQRPKKPKFETKDFKSLDLFCGAGGLSLGLENAGFETICAIDQNKMAIETFNLNLRRVGRVFDITKLTHDKISAWIKLPENKNLDLISGGPPCQSFSDLNQNPDLEENKMVLEFGRIVQMMKPKFFMMENVKPLAGDRGKIFIDELKAMLSDYVFYPHIYNAVDYGVAQSRERFILVGKHRSIKAEFKIPEVIKLRKTVRNVISDLPSPPEDHTEHLEIYNHKMAKLGELNKKRISFVPQGGGWQNIPFNLLTDQKKDLNEAQGFSNLYGRLAWDEPSPTITTGFDNFSRGRFAHPIEDRAITAREASRIQSFPDWFRFLGNQTEIRTQIGNAVPPLLAEAIGYEIVRCLK